MPEHVRKRIFDPFFTTKGEVGTGLGLSVSYSIIQRHGGEMRAESQPGRGTTFTIVAARGHGGEESPPADSETLGTRRGRILLVDNELPVMTVLGEMLTEVGHHVLPVASGAEAVRVFVPGGFDLVMTNLGMTGLTGWDVAERIAGERPARAGDLHHGLGTAGGGPRALPEARRAERALQARASQRAAPGGCRRRSPLPPARARLRFLAGRIRISSTRACRTSSKPTRKGSTLSITVPVDASGFCNQDCPHV